MRDCANSLQSSCDVKCSARDESIAMIVIVR